jgi:serine/threonine protein kinase/Flp pilus assembly protein TadD
MKMTEQSRNLLSGRYRITQELARGGFGITYLAEDTQSSNPACVIKKLDPQNADIETAKTLFKREVAILRYLQQNLQIPKYFNYFEEGQNYYLVQEYIKGKPLHHLLNEEWAQPRVINFLHEILTTLKYLHQINVIHRDIKPSNVMRRDEDKNFVLIDFGAVKQLNLNYLPSQHQPPQTMIGTPGYAPPEQMSGRPGFNSDIYGLGITAIHLLTKIHPRDLRRDERDNIIWDNGVSIDNSLGAILRKMVYSNPEHRYQSVEDVLNDLGSLTAVNEQDYFNNLNGGSTIVSPEGSNNLQQMMTVSQNNALSNNSINQQSSSNNQNYYSNNNSNYNQRIHNNPSGITRWKIPLILAALSAIALLVELINPYIRPLYYSYQGNHLLDVRQPEKALEQFLNLTALKPNSSEGWKGRGDALFSLGRDPAALASYNKARSLQPNDPKTLNNIGKVLYKQRKYKEALDIHEQVIEIDSNNPEAWSGKGLAYVGLQQYQLATESFDKLKQINPEEPSIWLQIGLATKNLQGPEAAKTYFEEALSSYDDFLKRKPKDPIAWSDRGLVLLQLNRSQDALDSYEKALEIDKNFYEALLGKGNVLGSTKPQDALLAFDRAAEIRPQDYNVWFNRGSLLAQYLKNYEEALKSFDKAIERRYNSNDAWVNKGSVLLELNRYDEALAAFDKAKDLNPKDPYTWANRGYALEKLGRTQEAQMSYKIAVQNGLPPEELKNIK